MSSLCMYDDDDDDDEKNCILNYHEVSAPQPHGIPLFLLRLATKVNWSEEQEWYANIRPCHI